jgi:hypothetical protein
MKNRRRRPVPLEETETSSSGDYRWSDFNRRSLRDEQAEARGAEQDDCSLGGSDSIDAIHKIEQVQNPDDGQHAQYGPDGADTGNEISGADGNCGSEAIYRQHSGAEVNDYAHSNRRGTKIVPQADGGDAQSTHE